MPKLTSRRKKVLEKPWFLAAEPLSAYSIESFYSREEAEQAAKDSIEGKRKLRWKIIESPEAFAYALRQGAVPRESDKRRRALESM